MYDFQTLGGSPVLYLFHIYILFWAEASFYQNQLTCQFQSFYIFHRFKDNKGQTVNLSFMEHDRFGPDRNLISEIR